MWIKCCTFFFLAAAATCFIVCSIFTVTSDIRSIRHSHCIRFESETMENTQTEAVDWIGHFAFFAPSFMFNLYKILNLKWIANSDSIQWNENERQHTRDIRICCGSFVSAWLSLSLPLSLGTRFMQFIITAEHNDVRHDNCERFDYVIHTHYRLNSATVRQRDGPHR